MHCFLSVPVWTGPKIRLENVSKSMRNFVKFLIRVYSQKDHRVNMSFALCQCLVACLIFMGQLTTNFVHSYFRDSQQIMFLLFLTSRIIHMLL